MRERGDYLLAGLHFPSTVTTKHRVWFQGQVANKYDTSALVTVKQVYSSWEYYQMSLVTK